MPDPAETPTWEKRKHPYPERLGIAIVGDAPQAGRGILWHKVLNDIHCNRGLPIEFRYFHLTCDNPACTDHFLIRQLKEYQVLVINWDAANGDPDFKADFVQRWFEHRRREILLWVQQGNMLIIEGQATLSVPTQRAYDAILGEGEVPLAGAEKRLEAGIETKRTGKFGRTTWGARQRGPFKQLDITDLDSVNEPWDFDQLFPGTARLRLTGTLTKDENAPDWDLLYRGWFRPLIQKPIRRKKLPWIALVTTANRPFELRHAILMATPYGEGAGIIFASTMFLSGFKQAALVKAILSHYGHPEYLPHTLDVKYFRLLRSWGLTYILPAGIGFGVAVAYGHVPVRQEIRAAIPYGTQFALIVILPAIGRAFLFIRETIREVIGW